MGVPRQAHDEAQRTGKVPSADWPATRNMRFFGKVQTAAKRFLDGQDGYAREELALVRHKCTAGLRRECAVHALLVVEPKLDETVAGERVRVRSSAVGDYVILNVAPHSRHRARDIGLSRPPVEGERYGVEVVSPGQNSHPFEHLRFLLLLRVGLIGWMSGLERRMRIGEAVDAQDARDVMKRQLETPRRVYLRHQIGVCETRHNAEAPLIVSNEPLECSEPVADPAMYPGLHLLAAAPSSCRRMLSGPTLCSGWMSQLTCRRGPALLRELLGRPEEGAARERHRRDVR